MEMKWEGVSRVQEKRKQLLCMFMVMILCILGIFFENYQTDHSLMCAAKESSSQISNATEVVSNIPLCTNQMPGIRGNIRNRLWTVLFAKQAKSEKSFLDYFSENVFVKKTGNVYTESDEIYFLKNLQKNLIVNYLHKSDGKKRI